jgi:hypothetical protein
MTNLTLLELEAIAVFHKDDLQLPLYHFIVPTGALIIKRI